MKKLLLTLSVIAGLLSNAFAIDLISVATNGKSNENSLGVKTLNNQEMSEVIGGATILKHLYGNTYQYFIPYNYGTKDNSGTRISYTAYYKLFEDYTNELTPLNVDDGSNQYIPVVKATLNHLNNQVNISIIGMNQNNPVYTRPADRYYADKLLDDRKILNEINGVIRSDANKYWGIR